MLCNILTQVSFLLCVIQYLHLRGSFSWRVSNKYINKSTCKQVCQIRNTSSSMNWICISREHRGSNPANIRFWKHFLKTSWSRYLQDILKTYQQARLFLLTPLSEAFNTFLTFMRRCFQKTVIYRGICLSNTTSDKFMVSVPNLQKRWIYFWNFSCSLYYTL